MPGLQGSGSELYPFFVPGFFKSTLPQTSEIPTIPFAIIAISVPLRPIETKVFMSQREENDAQSHQ